MDMSLDNMHKITFVLDIVIIFMVAFSIGEILVTGACSVITGICNGLIAIMWLIYGIYADYVINSLRKMIEGLRY